MRIAFSLSSTVPAPREGSRLLVASLQSDCRCNHVTRLNWLFLQNPKYYFEVHCFNGTAARPRVLGPLLVRNGTATEAVCSE
jgi:hypothetical protein